MLMELLSKAATVAMLSFVVTSMPAMGAGLKNWRNHRAEVVRSP
jgi:hypothetical protein